MKRRTKLLLGVLVVALIYLGWTRGGELFDPGGGSATGSVRGGGADRGVVGAEIAELRTADLAQKPGVYRPGRDLFRYGRIERPTPVLPPPRPAPPPRPRPQLSVPTPTQVPPERRPPPVDVAYLGSFGHPGREIAVFTDDEAIYNAKVGEVIKGAFRLVNIGFESVDLEFVGFPEVAAHRLPVGGP